jgi:hypothetical protein
VVKVLVMAKLDEDRVEPTLEVLLIEPLLAPLLLVLLKIIRFFGFGLFLLTTISPKTISPCHCFII